MWDCLNIRESKDEYQPWHPMFRKAWKYHMQEDDDFEDFEESLQPYQQIGILLLRHNPIQLNVSCSNVANPIDSKNGRTEEFNRFNPK